MKLFLLLILIHFANFLCAIRLKIRESDVNNQYSIKRGSLLTLTCESDSISQNEIIQWFLPSSPISPVTDIDSTHRVSYRIEVVGNKKSILLTIRDISNEYSGKYFCKSYLYEGNSQIVLASAEVLVSLFKPITSVNCNNDQWIMINTKGLLRCELDSEPRAIVTWEFKNIQLTQSIKYKITDYGLEISDVDSSDAGQYVVKARSIDYSSSLVRDIVVTIFELPRIISGPKIIGPITDGVVEYWYSDIQCLATGNPMPTVHWFRKENGNQELQLVNPQKFFINTNPKVGTMRITWPVYPDDNDEYTCQAMLATDAISNINFPKDVVSRSINISVTVRPQFTQLEQMNTLQDEGKTAFIRCRVRTTEPVQLIWQKYLGQAYELGTQKSDPRIKVFLDKEPLSPLYQVLRLQIDNVQFSDSWNYTCIATNPGSNYSVNGTISVRRKPIISNLTSTIEFGWLFNATNLTCISQGLPHPTNWFWYRRGYSVYGDVNSTFRIISYDFETSSQSWLQIVPDLSTQYWIYDEYECQARNVAGEDRKKLSFQKAEIPSPPRLISIHTSSSSIEFNIEPSPSDGGMKVLHYELIYRALQGPTLMYGPVIYQPDQSKIVMDGLIHDKTYQFSFYSCNAVGRSIDFTILRKTLSASVPFPIEVISKSFSGYPYGYNLQWKVPINGGYPLLGYKIHVWSLSVSSGFIGNNSCSYLVNHPELLKVTQPVKIYEPILSNPYESVFRLDDLEAETIYRVSIEAKNMIGYSNKTYHYFYTDVKDALGKPPRVRGFQIRLKISTCLYLSSGFIMFFHLWF